MKSMTGFGAASVEIDGKNLSVELSSVNKKGLEIGISLPREWTQLERLVTAKIRERFSRGKISAYFKFDSKGGNACFDADPSAVSFVLKKLEAIARENGVDFNPDARLLFDISKTLSENSSCRENAESAWEKIAPVLDEAMDKLDIMREAEGCAIKSDLKARLAALSKNVEAAKIEAAKTPSEYRDVLVQKLKNLGIENIDASDERVLKEICIFADRCDVAEEITRLGSHISQFLSTMDENISVGRKLDFICQEMGREINTTASKANNLELTRLTISMKNLNEQIREQVQNAE